MSFRIVAAAALIAGLASGSALASPMAYIIDKFGEFGTVDLTTGVRTDISATGIASPTGLAVGSGNSFYTEQFTTNNFYQIDATTGAQFLLTIAGNVTYAAIGSIGNTVYTLSTAGELYRVNAAAGTLQDIGFTGVVWQPNYNKPGLSVNGSALYASDPNGIYMLNVITGASTFIGKDNAVDDIITLFSLGGTLYGSTNPDSSIVTLNPATGMATNSLASPQNGPGGTASIFGLAVFPAATTVPEPATWTMLAFAASLLAFARIRRT